MRIIIDFDGTLTAEETQAETLRHKSLRTLADEIIGVPYAQLERDYLVTQRKLLDAPHLYWWAVNGLIASYCDEGAFILNTTTLQTMLNGNPDYVRAIERTFSNAEYDPAMDCINHLFHRHTAEIPPAFRPGARDALNVLIAHPDRTPMILTNSLGDKVRRQIDTLNLDGVIDILGDTRQYAMAPDWPHHFVHPELGEIQRWAVTPERQIDLRRPIYYKALCGEQNRDPQLAVVADTFSLPGALPLLMGIPFFLLRTPYTPEWCIQAVKTHRLGYALDEIAALPEMLNTLAQSSYFNNI
ncbi:MAG: haloacid dehalogenase-like hydrolase [Anaerolineae bacterium]|nr:haloacid dehalogenase-like hydrolase [Anaerolineae bacterium]